MAGRIRNESKELYGTFLHVVTVSYGMCLWDKLLNVKTEYVQNYNNLIFTSSILKIKIGIALPRLDVFFFLNLSDFESYLLQELSFGISECRG